jgi:hypothetical protein
VVLLLVLLLVVVEVSVVVVVVVVVVVFVALSTRSCNIVGTTTSDVMWWARRWSMVTLGVRAGGRKTITVGVASAMWALERPPTWDNGAERRGFGCGRG